MGEVLDKTFFERKTLVVARDLLGKVLVRRIGTELATEQITEVEAYVGPHDLACHSSHGKTKRNEVMYREAGTIYVYFTYGMHWMLNIVTEEKGFPAAVLIRGTEHFSGPARLTKALEIDKKLNGEKLGKKTGLWIEDSPASLKLRRTHVLRTARIGVGYAGEIWANKKYRFVVH